MKRRALLTAATLAAAALPGLALASGPPEKKKGGGASYLQISAIVATTNTSGRRGVLTVETGVDIPDAALRARCEQSLPRLRAAYVQMLQTYAAALNASSVPNADFIALSLQRETDRVLGAKGARLLVGTILLT